MVLQKSPGGSAYPYYFKGGTLLGLHYGSFFKDEEALLARMQAEEQFITIPSGKARFGSIFIKPG